MPRWFKEQCTKAPRISPTYLPKTFLRASRYLIQYSVFMGIN